MADRPASTGDAANVAYFGGEDAFALEQAVKRMRAELTAIGEMGILRLSGEDDDSGAAAVETGGSARRRARLLDQLEQALGTAPLFGGGTFVNLRQPVALMRDGASQARLIAVIRDVPAGNALALTDLTPAGGKRTRASDLLRETVEAAGGIVGDFPAPTRERMERWLGERARELGVRLGTGAAHLLAERIGAYVREGDIDRRRQSELANSELEKLVLRRPDGIIERADVAELVPEAVPGSMWALLDAVGSRRGREIALSSERLLAEGMPLPVLVSQLHRRLRDLIAVRELLDGGTRPSELPRVLKLQPYRAQRLAEQAGGWTATELQAALFGLVDLDLESKGIGRDGTPLSISEERSLLSLEVWLADAAGRAAGVRAR